MSFAAVDLSVLGSGKRLALSLAPSSTNLNIRQEIFLGKGCDEAVDIWATGVTLYALMDPG